MRAIIRVVLALAVTSVAALAPTTAQAAKPQPSATFVGCNYDGAGNATAVIVVRNVTKRVTWSAHYYDADGEESRIHGHMRNVDRRVFRFDIDMAAEQLLRVRIERGDTVLMNARVDDLEHCGSSYSQT